MMMIQNKYCMNFVTLCNTIGYIDLTQSITSAGNHHSTCCQHLPTVCIAQHWSIKQNQVQLPESHDVWRSAAIDFTNNSLIESAVDDQMRDELVDVCIQDVMCKLTYVHILVVYSHHIDSYVWFHTSDLLSAQSLSTNTAARWFSCCTPQIPIGTVFRHLYVLLTVSLVLGLSSRLNMFARHL